MIIDVKYSSDGVMLISNMIEGVILCNDPSEIQKIIDKLQEAKAYLVESQARLKEESRQHLWEGI